MFRGYQISCVFATPDYFNFVEEKIVITSNLCPGDTCVLTGAIRALKECHPHLQVGFRGTAEELFVGNPFIHHGLDPRSPDVRTVEAHYPAIQHCNSRPHHFIEGYTQYLSEVLRLPITLNRLTPDIYITESELRETPLVKKLTKSDAPYWVILAGGKQDYTTKIWPHDSYQAVVDELHGKIQFVQAGELHHVHAPLDGVINLLGKTSTREFVKLVYHSQGVLCPITFAMHLAAGVPPNPKYPPRKPCVVINGGREPVHWEQYQWHTFLHNVGKLHCCSTGGCWKSKVDPDEDNCCINLVHGNVPRCLDLITPEHVVTAIQSYFLDEWNQFLTEFEYEVLSKYIQ